MSLLAGRGIRLLFTALLGAGAVGALGPDVAALELSAGAWSGPALPEGGPATASVTLSYECGSLLPAPLGDDITVAAAPAETTGGSAGIDPGSFAVQAPPDCTAGEVVEENATVRYEATRFLRAGAPATVHVRANASAVPAETTANATLTATVGPFLEVAYEAVNASQPARPGEVTTIAVRVTSRSNTEILAHPNVRVPAGWPQPDAQPVAIASPLADGATGNGTARFDLAVPENASAGENTVEVRLLAHTLEAPVAETDPVTLVVTLDVEAGAETPDENDSPAPGFVLLAAAAAALAAQRRVRRAARASADRRHREGRRRPRGTPRRCTSRPAYL